MKKIICLLLIAVFALAFTITANAESNVDVTMVIDYEYDNDTVKLTAKFVDIKLEEGIILADYCINYDEDSLKLVEHRTIYPKDWEQYLETEMVESFFAIGQDKKFHWSVFTTPAGIGCKEDNELGVYLEFKVLNKEDTTIELEYYDILTEYIKDGKALALIPASGNTATIDIDFDEPEEPNIEMSDVTVSKDDNIFIPSESSVIDNDSTENNNSENNTPSVQKPNDKVSMPNIVQDSSVSDGSESDSSNWIVWALVGVGVLAIAVVAVFLVKSKRGKK